MRISYTNTKQEDKRQRHYYYRIKTEKSYDLQVNAGKIIWIILMKQLYRNEI